MKTSFQICKIGNKIKNLPILQSFARFGTERGRGEGAEEEQAPPVQRLHRGVVEEDEGRGEEFTDLERRGVRSGLRR